MMQFIAEALVDEPASVMVVEIQGGQSTIVELSVAEQDRGKIIGRQGRTADAMRTLLKAVGRKAGKTYILEIID
ncbi:RNA-binding protein [candidate division KSB3 bacterium]|uniref:RNA-binding protein KhpA n=1 Tax=candidate division KSB3 bacterium TaxID=2044937 RepID=A0A2G6E1G6_9BACT|nr:MAG: RNA-binding protein [candidate division KSB3 bacterium]PIE28542.1 MAG: RNA-binding protein [candidate division KSB3 bacterium]